MGYGLWEEVDEVWNVPHEHSLGHPDIKHQRRFDPLRHRRIG
jgi:hypothetical protein